MPKFLEQRLRREAAAKGKTGDEADRYVYGTMNNLGAMHGSKETAKGRAMQEKHDEDTMKKATVQPMREMRIEIHRGPKGKVSGFTVHHHMVPRPASKSGAFMQNEQVSQPFGADQHEAMMDHIHEHTAAQLGAASGNAKEEKAENEPEGGEGGEYEQA
jgi:hypothetical protein